ncbi:MDR family NADP-dependent oxidoreductase [Mycobacteroides abscessus]|uniref:MDR family NADP-dependent oxidoreductase n=1 Tax=Mycobacteroides abscessus TaxID=36809 RepID=UPI0002F1AC66|nr:NADP-dependent oxidoreductase [Mycobacteroides abscessus]
MTTPTNRLFRLHARPQGQVTEKDLELVEESITEINEGQALVRTLYLSLDPTNRVWMSELRSYIPPVELGAVMRGLGVGQVVESRRDDLPVGAFVLGFTGWQDYCVADDSILEFPFTVLPDPLPAPLPAFLGVLGHTGISAFIGVEMGDPQPGETVVVSAAAGAVGSIAGQLAKQRGARVVGIAGGAEKMPVTWWKNWALMHAWTGTRRNGASCSTPQHPTASTSTSRTSAARSWITS